MPVERTACVVGANGGIGAAVVARLAADGWTPLLCMDLPGEDAAAHAVGGIPFAIDLAQPESIAAAFAEARRRQPRLGLLVLAAGIVDTLKLDGLTLARWNHILAVNLTGPFLCCQAARDWLVDGGRIVTLGSLAGRTGGVLTGTAYAASKGGIESMTKSLAQDLAPRGITVNCVAPGAVETPMVAAHPAERKAAMSAATPLKRMGRPEEIAAAVAYLASDDAAFMTGAVLAINGGLRMD